MLLFLHKSHSPKTCQDGIKHMSNIFSVLNILIPNQECIENISKMISNKYSMLNFSEKNYILGSFQTKQIKAIF